MTVSAVRVTLTDGSGRPPTWPRYWLAVASPNGRAARLDAGGVDRVLGGGGRHLAAVDPQAELQHDEQQQDDQHEDRRVRGDLAPVVPPLGRAGAARIGSEPEVEAFGAPVAWVSTMAARVTATTSIRPAQATLLLTPPRSSVAAAVQPAPRMWKAASRYRTTFIGSSQVGGQKYPGRTGRSSIRKTRKPAAMGSAGRPIWAVARRVACSASAPMRALIVRALVEIVWHGGAVLAGHGDGRGELGQVGVPRSAPRRSSDCHGVSPRT